MREGEVLQGRYRIERILGQGGMGTTYLASDLSNEKTVVLKLLNLSQLKDWKSLELFEREATILKNLHHDCIPWYVDSFEEEGSRRFALIQQYIPGTILLEKVKQGWRGTEAEIRALAVKLLEIVSYIHSLHPPIIHRDINPKNIILREDGKLFLVDFGGVQDAIRLEFSSSVTVVGTPGYMPLEQFVGKATVRSDLYAVAATVLFLLTHRNPADLPTRDMKIDFRSAIDVSPGLSTVLSNYLEPDEKRRTLSIQKAIALLEGGETTIERGAAAAVEELFRQEEAPTEPGTVPLGSRIRYRQDREGIALEIPERGSGSPFIGCFAVFWTGFVAVWTSASIAMGSPIVLPLFSLPFWAVGLFLLYRALFGLFGTTGVRISRDGLAFERKLFSLKRQTLVPLGEVGWCSVEISWTKNNVPQKACRIEIGVKTVKFAEQLSEREQNWLANTINYHLRELKRSV